MTFLITRVFQIRRIIVLYKTFNWTIDGKQVKNSSLTTWEKPMHLIMSIWGVEAHSGFEEWRQAYKNWIPLEISAQRLQMSLTC